MLSSSFTCIRKASEVRMSVMIWPNTWLRRSTPAELKLPIRKATWPNRLLQEQRAGERQNGDEQQPSLLHRARSTSGSSRCPNNRESAKDEARNYSS